MQNKSVYPLKYAIETVTDSSGKILELGCGAGRVLRYFHDAGYKITGVDFIDVAVEKLQSADPTLDVHVGDVRDLKFPNEHFRFLLAFGLYHNIEHGLQDALKETARVLESGGRVCASFRADNLQTRMVDQLTEKKLQKSNSSHKKEFHKNNLTRREFHSLFHSAGFEIESIVPVVNMPILYKFEFFRSSRHKIFNEALGRKEGYRLSFLGRLIQSVIMRVFPNQFCNIYVLIGRKV